MELTEDNADAVIANPYYAVSFVEHVFRNHSEHAAKEDWVAANAYTLQDIGAQAWLSELLDFLSQTRESYDGHDILNPTTVINISERLSGEHDPIVSRDTWVQANRNAIDRVGIEAWLWRLLDVLETGGPEENAPGMPTNS